MRRGPPDSSPQQTGTSRTVKRYPSSSGPITSNALPSGYGYANGHANEHRNWHGHRNGHSNVHSFNTHRPTSDSQLQGQFNNALLPAGKNKKLHKSIAHCEVNVIKHGSVATLHAYLTFPLCLATSKQTRPTLAQFTEATIHTCTSCGVMVKWNISHKKKSWQLPRLSFPSPTVHPPHPLCGLHHQTDRRLISKLCAVCERLYVCSAGPQSAGEEYEQRACVCSCVFAQFDALISLGICTVTSLT